MRTTITIDDDLFDNASIAADEKNASSLITKALELLIATESKKRLLRLSGKSPNFTIPERDSRAEHFNMVAESQTEYNA